jgi:hypothetical protein
MDHLLILHPQGVIMDTVPKEKAQLIALIQKQPTINVININLGEP